MVWSDEHGLTGRAAASFNSGGSHIHWGSGKRKRKGRWEVPTTAEEEEEEWMDLLQHCDSIGQVTARDISWRRCHLYALFLSGPSTVYLIPVHTYSTDHTIHTYTYRTSSPQHRRCLVRYSKSRVRGSRSPPASPIPTVARLLPSCSAVPLSYSFIPRDSS